MMQEAGDQDMTTVHSHLGSCAIVVNKIFDNDKKKNSSHGLKPLDFLTK